MNSTDEKKPNRQHRLLRLSRRASILTLCAAAVLLVLWLSLVKALPQGLESPTDVVFGLILLLLLAAAAAIYFYQSLREWAIRDRLNQETARTNSLINAVLPGTGAQVFEVLPGGAIRLLSPSPEQGQAPKITLFPTPWELLASLNCSGQWEPAFLSALEQASLGQDSELEVQTLDKEETWIRFRLEPWQDSREADVIGTIREVTQEVQERYRQEEADKLINRMMEGTVVGLEISPEDNTWRNLWSSKSYSYLLDADSPPLP